MRNDPPEHPPSEPSTILPSAAARATPGPLAAVAAAIAVTLAAVVLEALWMRTSRGPARPAESLLEALPLALAVGVVLGGLGVLAARGRRAADRVRFGVPAALLLPAMLAVHLREEFLRPSDGLGTPRGLVWFGGALVLGLLAAALVLRGARPRTGTRAGLALIASLLALGGTWGLLRAPAPRTVSAGPNVVLVVLDTTRFDRLSAFGYGRETTPVLARLADQGVRFTRCYAAAPWTVPSHAAMFTGMHTSSHGATRQRPILDARLPTLAERQARAGLHTVAFAKKSWLSRETGLLRGFEEIHDLHNPLRQHAFAWVLGRVLAEDRMLDKGAAEIVRTASEWVREYGKERRFFAFFNFNEAHSDLRPPRRFREQFLPRELHATDWGRSRFPENHAFSVGEVDYDEATLAILSDLYDAEIAYQDARLGELVRAFEESALLDETLFIVTADHGENLGEHGLLGHEMSLHETLLHVPLVARMPGRLAAGMRVDAPVENRLLGRLVEGLSSGAGEADVDELVALLTDPDVEGIVSEEYAPNFRSPKWGFEVDERFDVIRKSLVDGTLKLHFVSSGAPALFDVVADPGERTDLAADRPELAERLLQRLTERAELWQDVGGVGVEFSAAMEDRLKQMGYF